MFYDKFKPNQFTIKDFSNWIILLREKQQTLGSAIFVLKNQKESLGLISAEEIKEFPSVVSWYENRVKSVFGANKFNYLAAMMKDSFVHFHVFPRYEKPVNFEGQVWTDENWPKLFIPSGEEISLELASSIIKLFQ